MVVRQSTNIRDGISQRKIDCPSCVGRTMMIIRGCVERSNRRPLSELLYTGRKTIAQRNFTSSASQVRDNIKYIILKNQGLA